MADWSATVSVAAAGRRGRLRAGSNLNSSVFSAKPSVWPLRLMLQTLGTTAEDAEHFAEDRRGNRKPGTTLLCSSNDGIWLTAPFSSFRLPPSSLLLSGRNLVECQLPNTAKGHFCNGVYSPFPKAFRVGLAQ